MNEIIVLNPNNERFPVSARELHEKLGFDSTHWAEWYKTNIIKDEGAVEGVDWEVFKPASHGFYADVAKNNSAEVLAGPGRPSKDFNLSIDFVKHLCMLARTEKGREIRNYFIEVEKRHRSLAEPRNEELVKLAKDKRICFTDVLQNHGCDKPYHYINITKQMKGALGIDQKKKKVEFGNFELMKTAISEDLATLGIMASGSEGYYECRDVSVEAADKVHAMTVNSQMRLSLKANN